MKFMENKMLVIYIPLHSYSLKLGYVKHTNQVTDWRYLFYNIPVTPHYHSTTEVTSKEFLYALCLEQVKHELELDENHLRCLLPSLLFTVPFKSRLNFKKS